MGSGERPQLLYNQSLASGIPELRPCMAIAYECTLQEGCTSVSKWSFITAKVGYVCNYVHGSSTPDSPEGSQFRRTTLKGPPAFNISVSRCSPWIYENETNVTIGSRSEALSQMRFIHDAYSWRLTCRLRLEARLRWKHDVHRNFRAAQW